MVEFTIESGKDEREVGHKGMIWEEGDKSVVTVGRNISNSFDGNMLLKAGVELLVQLWEQAILDKECDEAGIW